MPNKKNLWLCNLHSGLIPSDKPCEIREFLGLWSDQKNSSFLELKTPVLPNHSLKPPGSQNCQVGELAHVYGHIPSCSGMCAPTD